MQFPPSWYSKPNISSQASTEPPIEDAINIGLSTCSACKFEPDGPKDSNTSEPLIMEGRLRGDGEHEIASRTAPGA